MLGKSNRSPWLQVLLGGLLAGGALFGGLALYRHAQRNPALARRAEPGPQQQDEAFAAGQALLQSAAPRRALPWLLGSYRHSPHELPVRHALAEALAQADALPLPLPLQDARSGAFCGGNNRLVIGHEDGRTTLWEADSGRLLATLEGRLAAVDHVACSSDGATVLTQSQVPGDSDGESEWFLWDAASAQLKHRLAGGFYKGQAQFTADSQSLFGFGESFYEGGGKLGFANLYSVQSGEIVRKFAADEVPDAGLLSHDGTRVMTARTELHPDEEGGGDEREQKGKRDEPEYSISIWDVRSGKKLHQIDETGSYSQIQWSPDDSQVLALYQDEVVLRELRTGALSRPLKLSRVTVKQASFAPDGHVVLTVDEDRVARLSELKGGALRKVLNDKDSPILMTQFDATGRRLLSLTSRKEPIGEGSKGEVLGGYALITVWDVATGTVLQHLPYHPGKIRSVILSPSGEQILLIDAAGRAVVHRAVSQHPRRIYPAPDKQAGRRVGRAAWSPDGRFVLLGRDGESGKLWDAATGKHLFDLSAGQEENGSCCVALCFGTPSQVIGTIGYDWDHSEDKQIWYAALWDGSTGKRLHVREAGTLRLSSVAVSPDGRLIAAGTEEGKVLIWDVSNQKPSDVLNGHAAAVLALGFSPDGKWLVSGSVDGTARLWELPSKQLSRTLERAAARVVQVGFSHSGRQVFTASIDNTFRTFDVGSGALLRTLSGPANNLISAALSGDDKLVALADSGPLLHLFDLESGVLLRDVGPSAAVVSMGFGAAGSQLLTVEAQGSIAAWNLTTESRAPAAVADWMRAHSRGVNTANLKVQP